MLECEVKPYCVAPTFQRTPCWHRIVVYMHEKGVLDLSSNGRPTQEYG